MSRARRSQVHGGYGYTEEFRSPVRTATRRCSRSARARARILRLVIARHDSRAPAAGRTCRAAGTRCAGGAVTSSEPRTSAAPQARWVAVFSEIERDEPTPHRETVDVVVDASWRIVRTRIETGSTRPSSRRRGLIEGVRDGHQVEMAWGTGDAPGLPLAGLNAITTRRLEDAPAEGTAQDIDVLFLEPVTVEPVPMRQRYELLRRESVETPPGMFLRPDGATRRSRPAGRAISGRRTTSSSATTAPSSSSRTNRGRGTVPDAPVIAPASLSSPPRPRILEVKIIL